MSIVISKHFIKSEILKVDEGRERIYYGIVGLDIVVRCISLLFYILIDTIYTFQSGM